MMNIVLITDENYINPTGTAIASVIRANPNDFFEIYIVTKGLSCEHVAVLESFIKPYKENVVLKIIPLPEDLFTDFPIRANDHVSIATYYRIYFPKLLPQNVDKVLFLDGDVLCVDTINEFYNTDLRDYSCAVIHDERNDDPKNFRRLKYPKENGYFCAGVMLINLEWWREHNVMQNCLDYIAREPESCLWHDQDALNHVLNDTVLWADFRYNLMQGFFFEKTDMLISERFYKEIDSAVKNPCILHFSSTYKPWHTECNHPLKKLYRKFYKEYTGKKLHLVHKLTGVELLKWQLKRVIHKLNIKHYADFRRPVI